MVWCSSSLLSGLPDVGAALEEEIGDDAHRHNDGVEQGAEREELTSSRTRTTSRRNAGVGERLHRGVQGVAKNSDDEHADKVTDREVRLVMELHGINPDRDMLRVYEGNFGNSWEALEEGLEGLWLGVCKNIHILWETTGVSMETATATLLCVGLTVLSMAPAFIWLAWCPYGCEVSGHIHEVPTWDGTQTMGPVKTYDAPTSHWLECQFIVRLDGVTSLQTCHIITVTVR